MKKLLAGTVLAMAITGFVASAHAGTFTVDYGWEENPTTSILGKYSSISSWVEDGSTFVRTGDYSLGLEDGAATGTPEAYLTRITGLKDGDQVSASFWVYDTTPSTEPSGRIWAYYMNGTTRKTSAGGNDTYSGASTWSELAYTVTFNSSVGTRDSLIFEARTYSNPGVIIYIDDLTITAPDTATIITPAGSFTAPVPVPSAALLFGTGLIGLLGLRRKNA